MEREAEAPQPQLHGVVIISLPPSDDPSKGKTITAFTYATPPPPPPPLPPPPVFHPAATRTRARRSSCFPSSSRRRRAIYFLGATLVLFSLWVLLFSEGPLGLLGGAEEEVGSREDDGRSFVFPLYPKSSGRVLREGGGVKLASVGARDVDRRTRNSSAVFHLGGNLFPDGQYYTTIFVGDSPRPYFLDVDTGSDLTWIQCDAPCSSCAKGPHPLYKPTRGNIVLSEDSLCLEVQKNNYGYCDSCKQCDYDIEYADHSSSMGVLARDDMHLVAEDGARVKQSFVFGCAYDQQGQLLASPAKTDGIIGLSNSKVSLPSQLESQGIISNVIGHCIKTEADGGYMFLGDAFVPLWGMTWVPTHRGLTNFYRTEVSKINHGGKQLAIGGNERRSVPLVFDTGSSYTYFPNEAYTSLITSLKFVSHGMLQDESDPTLPICWRPNYPIRSEQDLRQIFEPLTLKFGKKWWVMSRTLSIAPGGYLMISNKGNVCLGVLNGTEVHDGSTIILGDISLRGKMVVYDNTQQRIGWVQSDCSRPQRSRGFPFFF